MNWVGGARSRINRRSDKRVQEQFFEEKRKAKQLTNQNTSSSQFEYSNSYLSQDILSFKRLSNVINKSEQALLGSKPAKMARFVDLDNTKPRAQFININDTSARSISEGDCKSSVLVLGEKHVANRQSKMKKVTKTTFEDKIDFEVSVSNHSQNKYLEESIIDAFEVKLNRNLKEEPVDTKEEPENLIDDTVQTTQEISEKKVIYTSKVDTKAPRRQSVLVLEPEEKAAQKFQEVKKKNPFFNLFD